MIIKKSQIDVLRADAVLHLSINQSHVFLLVLLQSGRNERSFDRFRNVHYLCVFCPWAWNHFFVMACLRPFCLLQPQRPWCEPWSCWTTWRRSTTMATWRSWAPWWQSSPWTPSWPKWSSPAVNSTVPTRSSPSLPCCQVMLGAGLLCGSELLLFPFPVLVDRASEITNELKGHAYFINYFSHI